MLSAHCAPKKASTTVTGLSYLPPSLRLNLSPLSHTHMHTHLGTFTLSISMWQSAGAFECCAWYAAFGKCEYELHKSSRGNGGSLCQLRQARQGRAGQGSAGTAQASPGFTAFRLRTAESTKKEKTQSRSRRE